MTLRKYSVLTAIVLFSSLGEVSLSHGMKKIGAISLGRWTEALNAVTSPFVVLGIVLLLGFFAAYLTALSWADLSYVLPATALGYVVIALLSVWLLDETVAWTRWLGILLVSTGVGLVAGGPELTPARDPQTPRSDP